MQPNDIWGSYSTFFPDIHQTGTLMIGRVDDDGTLRSSSVIFDDTQHQTGITGVFTVANLTILFSMVSGVNPTFPMHFIGFARLDNTKLNGVRGFDGLWHTANASSYGKWLASHHEAIIP